LLYYMATGSAPTEALQRYTAGADLPTIASLRPGFPADLEATIVRLMAVDPAQRPQSVEEVLPVEEARPAEPEELRLPEALAVAAPAEEETPASPQAEPAGASTRKLSMWQLMFGKKTQKGPAAPSAAPTSPAPAPSRAPMVDLSTLELNREIGRLLPEATSRSIGGVCIGQVGPSEITVAVKDPSDVHVYDNISCGTRGVYQPTIVGADPDLIDHALDYIYKGEQLGTDTTWLKFLDLKKLSKEAMVVTSQSAEVTFGEDVLAGPIVAAVDRLIKEAIASGASDLHLEPYEWGMDLRYRIDGVLRKVNFYKPEDANAIVKRIKVLGNLDIAQERVTQGGRISLKVGGQEFDMRVSVIPVPGGESVVMRVLKKGAFTLKLADLGFDADKEERFRNVLSQPYGMILVCGPTGSGKSTTLYASLKEIQRPDRKLLTVEDPIEYQMPGIMQVQVNMAPREEDKRVTFSKALREFLRQDPDVILVGEIRDPETAHIAVQAALTGHLLLSTIHTNDSIGIVARLADMGCEPFLIGSTLLGGLAQRLARRICPNCKEEVAVPAEYQELFAREGVDKPRMFQGKGCQQCHSTGNKGRVGLYELLEVTPDIRSLINSQALEQELRATALAQGFKPLLKDGLDKVCHGLVTLEEVLRVCKTL
ncbi:MAG: ATPase, T2SS/T4P/T4SS family, partial [Candidatus Eremiobacterota bacterium]